MSMRKWLMMAMAAAVLTGGSPTAEAGPDGVWLRPSTGGKIRSFACGGGLGLKVVASKTPAFVGETIMCGARQVGTNAYEGQLRHLEQGGVYLGKVEILGRVMRLSGCIMNGLVCRTEDWRKVD
jgi:uncharacterized protein (DUF2147 family)